ncbi:MAG: sigma-54 dependent transcriptional regulator [candidate division KSB1 bacterium]|nr:sigma-54 dependent transcriptional regulator [candidate division KSB1 bacterium]
MAKKDKNKKKILVVDDSVFTLKLLERKIKEKPNFHVLTSSSADEAIKSLNNNQIDLVITDKVMPSIDGINLTRHIKENFKNIGIIMVTGYASVGDAVKAVKTGAEEYLEKPIGDEALFAAIDSVLEKVERRKLLSATQQYVEANNLGIIGESEPMKRVLSDIAKAATIPATVLITGESGTGKELVAQAIHRSSPRSAKPFVAVNCSAIPESLMESELFGNEKGAYTGAHQSREGFFQKADKGTIFLDEIATTSFPTQSKLLRVLQEKEIIKVGSSQPQKIDVKIVAATNRELWNMMQNGQFREDLYYRLNVLTINLPPLSERSDDIFLLFNYFTEKYSKELDRKPPKFSDEVYKVFQSYSWPGNVRELENLVQRLVVMKDLRKINVPDLPEHMRYSVRHSGSSLQSLAEIEAEHIERVLQHTEGNKSKAAEILGIDRKTLRDKIKKYKIVS